MKVGIIGSGDVGRALGHAFIQTGHEVTIGSREAHSEKLNTWKNDNGDKAHTGSFEEAAQFGEIIVLATLWSGTESAIKMSGNDHFANKIVIDVTNPLDFSGGVPPILAVGHTTSGGEMIQQWLPASKVVKTLNLVGNGHMYQPDFPEGKPTMFLCGIDAESKTIVHEILKSFGWNDVVDMGGIEKSRLLESLAMLWIEYGFVTNTWNHAFKLLRK